MTAPQTTLTGFATQTDTRIPYRVWFVEGRVHYVDVLADDSYEATDIALLNELSWKDCGDDCDVDEVETCNEPDFSPINALPVEQETLCLGQQEKHPMT